MSPLRNKIFFYFSYFRNPPWDTGISPPELIAFIDSHSPGRALDIGCGTGTNAITLAKYGWRVTGVDFVGKAIRKARSKAKRAGVQVEFLINNATHLDKLQEQFDLILDIGCFHSLPPQEKSVYVKNLERLLHPGGTFLLYGFLKQPSIDGPGITAADLNMLETVGAISHQEFGNDGGQRSSGWFWIKR